MRNFSMIIITFFLISCSSNRIGLNNSRNLANAVSAKTTKNLIDYINPSGENSWIPKTTTSIKFVKNKEYQFHCSRGIAWSNKAKNDLVINNVNLGEVKARLYQMNLVKIVDNQCIFEFSTVPGQKYKLSNFVRAYGNDPYPYLSLSIPMSSNDAKIIGCHKVPSCPEETLEQY